MFSGCSKGRISDNYSSVLHCFHRKLLSNIFTCKCLQAISIFMALPVLFCTSKNKIRQFSLWDYVIRNHLLFLFTFTQRLHFAANIYHMHELTVQFMSGLIWPMQTSFCSAEFMAKETLDVWRKIRLWFSLMADLHQTQMLWKSCVLCTSAECRRTRSRHQRTQRVWKSSLTTFKQKEHPTKYFARKDAFSRRSFNAALSRPTNKSSCWCRTHAPGIQQKAHLPHGNELQQIQPGGPPTRLMQSRDPEDGAKPTSSGFPVFEWGLVWPPLKHFYVYMLHIISANACQKLWSEAISGSAAVQLQTSHHQHPEPAFHIWKKSTDRPTRASAKMSDSIQTCKSRFCWSQQPSEMRGAAQHIL